MINKGKFSKNGKPNANSMSFWALVVSQYATVAINFKPFDARLETQNLHIGEPSPSIIFSFCIPYWLYSSQLHPSMSYLFLLAVYNFITKIIRWRYFVVILMLHAIQKNLYVQIAVYCSLITVAYNIGPQLTTWACLTVNCSDSFVIEHNLIPLPRLQIQDGTACKCPILLPCLLRNRRGPLKTSRAIFLVFKLDSMIQFVNLLGVSYMYTSEVFIGVPRGFNLLFRILTEWHCSMTNDVFTESDSLVDFGFTQVVVRALPDTGTANLFFVICSKPFRDDNLKNLSERSFVVLGGKIVASVADWRRNHVVSIWKHGCHD